MDSALVMVVMVVIEASCPCRDAAKTSVEPVAVQAMPRITEAAIKSTV